MTVTNQINKVVFVGTGAQTVFAYTFRIFEDSDLVVKTIVIATGVEVTLVLNSDYTVTGAGGPSGGDVTLLIAAPPSTQEIAIQRLLPLTQETDYVENDDFPAESHEEGLDRLTMIVQQISEVANRALQVAINATGLGVTLPPPLADATIGWDAAGTQLINNPASAVSNFTGLADTPSSFSGQSLLFVRVNAGETALEFATPGAGATEFTGLTDTPGSFSGQTLKVVRVNAGETALEFATIAAGAASVVTLDIAQTAHGLAVGDLVRLSGVNYVKAQADSIVNAEVVGIVSAVAGANDFTIQVAGQVTGLTGLTAGTVFFLSEATPGLLTATEPSTAGEISKPVLIADTTTSGWMLNFRGIAVAADVAVAGGALIFVSLTVISADAQIDITGIEAGFDYIFTFQNVTVSVDASTIQMRTSSDGGSTYDAGGTDYRVISTISSEIIITPAIGNAANEQGLSGDVFVFNPGDTTETMVWSSFGSTNTAGNLNTGQIHGKRQSAAIVDAVRFLLSSGNFPTGNITVYKRKRS